MSEIKIGDTVDCSGNITGKAKCSPGIVNEGPDRDGDYWVVGHWEDDEDGHYVRPDQITRHVPAAPVVERPASCRDKLASEMTVRELFAKDLLVATLADSTSLDASIIWATNAANRLIAALDKERE